jgi:TRAP-type C4-dicarboxylate transport system substrate-binding protein
MAGLKIRTPESAVMIDTFTALGALPTAMPFNEVYMAAKQGVIDGAESAPYALGDAKAWEVASYYSLTKHITLTAGVVMNTAWFNSLTPEQQAAMIEARDEASAWYDSQFDANNEKVLETARANGMQINDVDNIEDFRGAVASVYEKYAPVVGGMEKIQAVIDTK